MHHQFIIYVIVTSVFLCVFSEKDKTSSGNVDQNVNLNQQISFHTSKMCSLADIQNNWEPIYNIITPEFLKDLKSVEIYCQSSYFIDAALGVNQLNTAHKDIEWELSLMNLAKSNEQKVFSANQIIKILRNSVIDAVPKYISNSQVLVTMISDFRSKLNARFDAYQPKISLAQAVSLFVTKVWSHRSIMLSVAGIIATFKFLLKSTPPYFIVGAAAAYTFNEYLVELWKQTYALHDSHQAKKEAALFHLNKIATCVSNNHNELIASFNSAQAFMNAAEKELERLQSAQATEL